MNVEKLKKIVFLGLLLKILLSLARAVRKDTYELREDSIARRECILRPSYENAEFSNVATVHFDQSFLQRIFGYTDCVIQIEKGENVEYLRIRNITIREFDRIESYIFD